MFVTKKGINETRYTRWAAINNALMNMVEGGRSAAQIVVARNKPHAFFEDDVVLTATRDAVQRYVAQRLANYDYIPLGGCVVPLRTNGNGTTTLRPSFTCGHASITTPKLARAFLKLTQPCKRVLEGLDGKTYSRLCHGGVKCADMAPLLQEYQGAGWLPKEWDRRCSQCRNQTHTALALASQSQKCPACDDAAQDAGPRGRWVNDPRGWVGFGFFVQDRLGVKPHLHDEKNKPQKTHVLWDRVLQSASSISNTANASLRRHQAQGEL